MVHVKGDHLLGHQFRAVGMPPCDLQKPEQRHGVRAGGKSGDPWTAPQSLVQRRFQAKDEPRREIEFLQFRERLQGSASRSNGEEG
jgi:hypothetical protein